MKAFTSQRFAAIADIHGNSDALAAVLDDIEALGISEIVNLGDHLSGPLAAGETADMLIDRGMICIRGNHDRWLINKHPDDMGPSDKSARSQLTSRHLDWLAALPATLELGGEVFLCHGTPTSDTTYWMETVSPTGTVSLKRLADIESEAKDIDFPLILCGHSHLPRSVRMSDGRLLVNPGSVGCPGYDDDNPVPHIMQSGTPDACYAVLEKVSGRWQVSLRQVPYDTGRMVDLARQARRPEWANALATGFVVP